MAYSWSVENGTILSGAESDTLEVLWENPGDGEVAALAVNEFGCSSEKISLQVHITGTEV